MVEPRSATLLTGECQVERDRIGVGGGAGAAGVEGLLVVGEAGGNGVALDPFAGFLHQVREGGQARRAAGG